MHRVIIPQIFENMEEATIGRWLLAEGGQVNLGDPLCELITEKTTLDLTSEAAGVLVKIVAPDKAVVPPGFIVALIGNPDEPLPDVRLENSALLTKKGDAAPANGAAAQASGLNVGGLKVPGLTVPPPRSGGTTSAPGGGGSRVRATPAARRAAKEAGVDMEAVALAFPGKVIGEEDVKTFASSAA